MYFKAAKWGKNGFFRYVLGLLLTLVGVLIGNILLLLILRALPNGSAAFTGFAFDPNGLVEAAGSKNGAFVLLTSSFLLPMAFFWLAVQVVHKKRMKWVATGAANFRWNQFWFSFFIGALVIILNVVISNILFPGELKFRFDAQSFGLLVLLAALYIPIQAGWEELVFRGYLMQGLGLLFKNRIIALLITSALFAALHLGNPEVAEHGAAKMFPMYLIMGLSFGLMVLLNGGLELAMGYHIANNVWLALLLSSPESVLQTDSLFYTEEVQDITGQIWPLIAFNLIVLAIFAWKYNWKENWKQRLFEPI